MELNAAATALCGCEHINMEWCGAAAVIFSCSGFACSEARLQRRFAAAGMVMWRAVKLQEWFAPVVAIEEVE